MKTLTICLMGLVFLCPTPVGAEDGKLWKAVFSLSEPGHRQQAEKVLMSSGRAGLEVLLKAARVGGEQAALQHAARALECHFFLIRSGGFHYSMTRDNVAPQAAALAVSLLSANTDLQKEMLVSSDPFERKFGIVSLVDDPVRLKDLVMEIATETDPTVVEVAQAVLRCAAFQTNGEEDKQQADQLRRSEERLEKKRKVMLPSASCEEPDFATGILLDGLVEGKYTTHGWSRSNEVMHITLMRDDKGTTKLSVACALALYDAAAKRGKYVPELIFPLIEFKGLGRETRESAAWMAERDLLHYPEDNLNKYAARLVNAGFDIDYRVTFKKDDPFAQELFLEAAARQGSPEALRAIDDAVLCRGTFGDKRILLLGFLGTRKAADLAVEIARRCPKARGSATIALLRLGDPRGISFLGQALHRPGFVQDKLEQAIEEHFSPAIEAELERLAQSMPTAKRLLQRLRKDGVARPSP
jgi:hypothetical protein